MKLKRGLVDVQFNWVFVLIAGAAILIIFTGIVMKEKNIFEASKNALMLKDLDIILSGSEISRGAVNVAKIPDAKIEFGCNTYSIGSASKQLNAISVFAPSVLEGNEIISMALGWSVPYRATNLLYLTNSRIRYIFVGDSIFARNAFGTMPEETRNDGYTQTDAIQDEKDNTVRIIFFGRNPEFPAGLKETKSKITALKIDGDENTGRLEFFDLADGKFESRGVSYYIGKSTLMGAIFADSLEAYDCTMKNIFKKLNIASQIYERKAINLKSYYAGQQCERYYDASPITAIKEASTSFNQLSVNSIDAAAKDLEEQNKQAQFSSCALIY